MLAPDPIDLELGDHGWGRWASSEVAARRSGPRTLRR